MHFHETEGLFIPVTPLLNTLNLDADTRLALKREIKQIIREMIAEATAAGVEPSNGLQEPAGKVQERPIVALDWLLSASGSLDRVI